MPPPSAALQESAGLTPDRTFCSESGITEKLGKGNDVLFIFCQWRSPAGSELLSLLSPSRERLLSAAARSSALLPVWEDECHTRRG